MTAAPDNARYQTPERLLERLEEAMKHADGLDAWHRYGEGYGELRTLVEQLIRELRA